jgi:N-acetylglutamate synthase-like GNAT family acetyltransferase
MATQILTDIIIRAASDSDLELLAAFITPFVEDHKLLPRTISELHELLPHFFVAEHEGKIMGCAALEVYSWKLAEIRSLAVAPEMQGQGLGRRLVEACVERARAQNILEVMAITSSDHFFMSCGFDYTLPGEKRALFIQTREV